MKRITLALGGGGTKGFAHIGVISQLEKLGYQIDAIAGTSAGGIVGSLYAYGLPINEIISFSQLLCLRVNSQLAYTILQAQAEKEHPGGID